MTNPENGFFGKIQKAINPKVIIYGYFIFSLVLIFMKIFDDINLWVITVLAILSVFFIFLKHWNITKLAILLIIGLLLFLLLNTIPLEDKIILKVNDIFAILLLNITIFWELLMNKFKTNKENDEKQFSEHPNYCLKLAIKDFSIDNRIIDMPKETAQELWDILNRYGYEQEDYKQK